MTSFFPTTHTRSPQIRVPRPANTPICRNTQIVYPPSHIESTVDNDQLVVKGDWHFGISGEDSCSPISLKVTVANNEISVEAVRVDNYSGVQEPVRLKPSMANGVIVGLNEHFRLHDAQALHQEGTYVVDPDALISGVDAEIRGIIDERFSEPLAPCAQVRAKIFETPVKIEGRTFI